ncbi:hypothetical protein GE061_014408 [Apolygus lucorum]|uniref:Uncharacterized protein n=1 Tax=Apolygus lucorum TaxID=248454 RepID=A0A6A4KC28_APOLU|nr:hypothetical protein GE061_014408 [Apolygus lucorum]
MDTGKSIMNEIKFDDYNVVRRGISHLGDRFGVKESLCRNYAYCKTNPSYNYYRDLKSNPKKLGVTANILGMYTQPCMGPPSELPLPLQPFISVGQSAAVTPKALLPRTIDYGDRMEADAFYTLCQYNRAFYKEIPVLRPWDYTFFSCGRPMFEQKNLTEQAKIRQEVPYKHPHVLPVTLCRTFGYKDVLGSHRNVPNISQGVETAFIS